MTPLDEGVLVEDLGSRNGTYVNGDRVEGSMLARPGDVISLGATRIEVVGRPVPEPPAATATAPCVIEVVGESGEVALRSFDLVAPLEVGRDPMAGISLGDDERVSWRHARLTPAAGGVLVEDLGSRNGTFVDGERIEQPTTIPSGGRIHVGDTTLLARLAPGSAPPAFVVVVVGGPDAGRHAELSGTLTIGRDPSAGLPLGEDVQVSRLHARLVAGGDVVSVEDLGSRNGTFVNGVLVRETTALRVGDRLVAGSTVLEVRRGDGRAGETVVGTGPRVAPTMAGAAPSAGLGQEPAAPAPAAAADEDRAHTTWTFLICAFALFMAVLDNLVVLFALPSIQQELNATVQDLEWTVNAFTLSFAVFLLPAATLGDRFGRRRVFASGVVLFTLASAACALAPSVEALLIARAVQGAGAAVITPLSLTVLSAAFPVQKRGLVLGAWSGIAGLAIAVGPVVGGVIVTGLDWQWIFWLNVPIGLLVAPLCLVFVRESFGESSRLDVVGIVLSAVGFFGVVFGVVRASAVGWSSPQVLVPLLVGLLLVTAFVLWETRTREPMLAMHLFRRRAFSAANVSSFCMYLGLFGAIFLLAQFLQSVQGYSALEAGLRSLPLTGMPIVVAPIAGALSERVGGRLLMALGLALEAAAFAWLAVVIEPGVAYGKLIGAFVLGGVGLGLFFAPVAHVILGSVRLEEEGQASGANNAIRQIGGVIGVAVMTTIFTSFGEIGTPQGFVDGLLPALWVAAAVLVVGAGVALVIPPVPAGVEARSMTTSMLPAVGGFTPGTTSVGLTVMLPGSTRRSSVVDHAPLADSSDRA